MAGGTHNLSPRDPESADSQNECKIRNIRYSMDLNTPLIGKSLSIFGALLLFVVLLGDFTSLGNYESSKPRDWERFDPALLSRTPTYESLIREAERKAGRSLSELPPAQVMDSLYATVVERFTHKSANHTFFSNWTLWAMGKLHPVFSTIRDERTLVSKGNSLFCDQSSFVLMSLANDMGITSRHVGLNGHVVMEAFYDSGWHLYDPDYEVVARDEPGKVLSVTELADQSHLLRDAYGGPKRAAVPLILSTEDNTFMSYPPGSWFVWKSQVLYVFEKVTNYLKYLTPMFLLAVGFSLARGRSRCTESRNSPGMV